MKETIMHSALGRPLCGLEKVVMKSPLRHNHGNKESPLNSHF